jgi:hypothetical protein
MTGYNILGQKRLKTLLKEKNALVRAPKGRKI